jgi:hypothetical protein
MGMTPDELLQQAIRRHALEKEKERMKEFRNDSSQDERKAVLKNDRQAQTYFERAQETIGEEMGGRFAHLAKASVTPVPQVPRQPPNSPFAGDVVPPEPPLGYSVNDMIPTGNPSEIAASIKESLARAIDEGSKVARKPDVSPDDGPIKRRV